MKTAITVKSTLLAANGGVLLLLISVAFAQDFDQKVLEKRLTAEEWRDWAKLKNMPVLVEKGPLRIFAPEDFPTNLDCEIHVGSHLYPSFRANGQTNELTRAAIDLGVLDCVTVLRKQTTNTTYLLMFLSTDEDGKIFSQFDLNLDGVWDVKESRTRNKQYISFEKDWLEVDEIKNRNSERPTATKGGKRYEFLKSWKLAQ